MYLIGVTGGSGSGKTSFAHKVCKNFTPAEVSILHMDAYYLPKERAQKQGSHPPNFDHPDAFDWPLLQQHLIALKNGGSIQAPVYDYAQHDRSPETLKVGPCRALILEGIFTLFKSELRELMDIKCFLHIDSDIRFTRRLNRDYRERGRSMESIISQYYETVRPMYEKFLAPQRHYADFIVGEETCVAASILSSHIKDLLRR